MRFAGSETPGIESSCDRKENVQMKRMIAGVLLLVGLGAGTMFAEDGWRDRRDIRRDQAKIAHDRRELRSDLYHGNTGRHGMSEKNCGASIAT
jgi:hypothetical protein